MAGGTDQALTWGHSVVGIPTTILRSPDARIEGQSFVINPFPRRFELVLVEKIVARAASEIGFAIIALSWALGQKIPCYSGFSRRSPVSGPEAMLEKQLV